MSRVTITIEDTRLEPIQKAAAERGLATAQYLRHLVELGWETEHEHPKGSVSNSDPPTHPQAQSCGQEFWQQGLSCVLESRYLLRYLVDTLEHPPAERDAVLQAVKHKAQETAAEWCANYSSNSMPLSKPFSKAGLEG